MHCVGVYSFTVHCAQAAGLYKGLSLMEHACVANAVSDSWRDDDLVGVPDGLQRVVSPSSR